MENGEEDCKTRKVDGKKAKKAKEANAEINTLETRFRRTLLSGGEARIRDGWPSDGWVDGWRDERSQTGQ